MSSQQDSSIPLLTIDEARKELRCGRKMIKAFASDGRLEMVRLGHRSVFITERSVRKLIKQLIQRKGEAL